MTEQTRFTIFRPGHRRFGRIALGLCLSALSGCAGGSTEPVEFGSAPAGVNRRMQLWKIAEPTEAGKVSATRPGAADPLAEPYCLSFRSIVQLVYHKSPLVAAAREEMIAAQHGLAEFKANLSRFEPFVQARADTSEFPERRDASGVTGEVVGGIEKETFDGAVLRVEGGVSGSRVKFGEVEDDQEAVESGSGSVLRARLEVPFAGSRKRQSRVISAAFQESNARKAVLGYVSDYRQYVRSSLDDYHQALYYLGYARAYELKIARLNELLHDPQMPSGAQLRIESSLGDARVLVDQYRSYYRTNLLSLLEALGVSPEETYLVEEREDEPSAYIEPARTVEGKQELLAEAYENNPKFRVLEDAISDAELKRAQAIQGDLDITAFVEGKQFPFGSETYDTRVGGWQLAAGVQVRLNDPRVLSASQLKAEAEIRQYRSQIQAERMSVQQQVATQADRLCSYYDSRAQILQNMRDTAAEFQERRRSFLNGNGQNLTIDDVLTSLNALITAHVRLVANRYQSWLAETVLVTATGEVYRMVGMDIDNLQAGLEGSAGY